MNVKQLIEELSFYDKNMTVYVEFEGKEEILSCNVNKIRLSRGFPVGFMISANDNEFKDMFEDITKK